MSKANYFGPERRRIPRDVRHAFGTVFVKLDGYWMARELLIIDSTTDTVRVRTLPDLRQYDFRIKLDGSEALFGPQIFRHERHGDHWEFTMTLGSELNSETLGNAKVRYDFPRPVEA